MPTNDHAANIAAAMLAFRRSRGRSLPAELFSEPAWDLLLDLFIADAQGRRLTAREVATESGVPVSIMARWLLHLTKTGFVIGDGDGELDDGLTLSAKAFAAIEALMAQAKELQAVV